MNELSARLRAAFVQHAPRTALVEPSRAWTYAELAQRVDHVSEMLREARVSRSTLVALGGGRTAARVADLVALFRVGAVPLLLCPRWPRLYRERCIARSGTAWSLDEGILRPILNPILNPTLRPSGVSSPAPARSRPLPDDAAYVIYTSGSSGDPKGVLVPHAGLVPVLDAQVAAFALTDGSRSLFMLGLGFDASLSDIGTALLAGATLVLEEDTATAPGRLLHTLARQSITYADVPPSYLCALDERALPRTLATLVVGGEVPPASDVRRLAPHVALFNVYGPTEASICTSIARCDASWSRAWLGQPIAGNRYSVRAGGTPGLPGGEGELVAGELLIEGPGVALGYLDDEALTSERFTLHGAARVFRTGDHVRVSPEGEWEFLGRVDRQLKRRGQLVAPEEIEQALCRTGLVCAASVHLSPESHQLVAQVELRGDVSARERVALIKGLRGELQRSLPPPLVPERIEVVTALARNVNGKLLHGSSGPGGRSSKTVDPTITAAWSAPRAQPRPRGPEDAGTLAFIGALMGDVLGSTPLAPDDDFYERGGDSLGVLEVLSRAEAGGWPLAAHDLLHGRTPRGALTSVASTTAQEHTRQALDARVVADGALPEGVSAGGGTRAPATVPPRGPTQAAHQVSKHRIGVPRTLYGQEVLLTGASGTLGRALLAPLLAQVGPEGRVHGLVRHPDACPEADARIVWHRGDVSAALLGLVPARYEELSRRVSAVLHLAGSLNAASPFEVLSRVNVDGARHVLSFVAAARPKALLLASSLSVFTEASPHTPRCLEQDELDGTQTVHTAYAASKWVAERLVRATAPRARPATIVRLGLLTGSASTGRGAERGQLARVIRGLARLGVCPAPPSALVPPPSFDVTPVDHAALTCVGLLAHDLARGAGGTYHVAAARPVTFAQLLSALQAEGLTLDACSWAELCARAGSLRDPSGDAVLAALSLSRLDPVSWPRHRALDLFAATGTHFSLVNTSRALAGTSYAAPQPDVGLLRLYVRSALQ